MLVNWKKRITYQVYRVQQKVAMTRQESYAIACILGLLLLGTFVKSIQKNTFLFDTKIYEESDSLFAQATFEMKKHQAYQDSLTRANSDSLAPDSTPGLKELIFSGGKININTASQEELERLPRIGPAMAQRIIEYRQTTGPFKRIEDLTAVKGIGPKTLERLKPQITVQPNP